MVLRVRLVFVLVVGLLGALAGGGCAASAEGGPYRRGAVAADHEVASLAGVEVLRAGGNAVDAAVATSFTLSVVRPYSCGIGGGGFMVIHLPDDPTHGFVQAAVNYREMAPAGVGPDYYESRPEGASTRGGTAVGVPGTVAGLLHALERYGTMERAEVLAPAIRAAEEGFTVDAHYMESVRELIGWFLLDPARRERFGFVWERFLRRGEVREGDVIRLPEQAAALRLIAERGASAFYGGPIGAAAARAVRADGGAMTEEDLRMFVVSQGDPLRFDFAGRAFLTMPPPSSGGVAMGEALGIWERLSPALTEMKRRSSTDLIATIAADFLRSTRIIPRHRLIESLKHAFADRAEWLGDPAFVEVPVERLLSSEYLDARAAVFDPDRTLDPAAYGTRRGRPAALADDAGTSHFCVVDRHGGAVSCTETINLAFGALLAVPEYGFVLNNEMDDFTTRRGVANAFGLVQSDLNLPAPGKRPLSSMTPTIVLDRDGEVEVIAGASGGPRIITGTAQAIVNVLLFGDSAANAVAAPRLHHQWSPDVLYMEHAWLEELRAMPPVEDEDGGEPVQPAEYLRSLGHRVEPTGAVGNVQLIRRTENGRWDAASDPRKGGRPAGY